MCFGTLCKVSYSLFSTIESFHCWECVRLTLKSFAISPFCTEFVIYSSCSTSHVHSFDIATKNKYFVFPQNVYFGWSYSDW